MYRSGVGLCLQSFIICYNEVIGSEGAITPEPGEEIC